MASPSAGRPEASSRTARTTQERRMLKRTERSLIVGLDIGTSKVVAIVGELQADGTLEVIGIGSHPSRGLKKGVVGNIESTGQAIQPAGEEAELIAGCGEPSDTTRTPGGAQTQPQW